MINARNLINSEKLDPRRIYHLLVRRAPSNIVGYSTHNWLIFGRRHELCVTPVSSIRFTLPLTVKAIMQTNREILGEVSLAS